MTKYGFEIEQKVITADVNRLTNQLWKLIPMREGNENWQAQLTTVITELVGFNEVLNLNVKFLILLSKLEGLKLVDTDFVSYRKTVFETISLLREITKDGHNT